LSKKDDDVVLWVGYFFCCCFLFFFVFGRVFLDFLIHHFIFIIFIRLISLLPSFDTTPLFFCVFLCRKKNLFDEKNFVFCDTQAKQRH